MKIGDEGSFYSGLSGKNKNDFVNGNAKFVTYMNVYTNVALNFDIEDKVQIRDTERQNIIEYGDILFTGSSETPDECGMSCVVTQVPEESIYLNSFCFGYRFNSIENILPDYCKHLFRSSMIRSAIAKTANGVTRFNVSKKLFANIEIPLPSLSEQQRIVDILDKFEGMVENVEKEILLRQKQYEFYREKMMSCLRCDSVKWVKIGDICGRVENGERPPKEMLKGEYPYINAGTVPSGYFNKYNSDANAVTTPSHGEGGIGFVDFQNKPFWCGALCFKLYANTEIAQSKYLFLALSANSDKILALKKEGGVPYFNRKQLCDIEIPLPPLAKQQEIVAKLDKFEEMISTLKKELELRKKQYEYYREKLLTFE
ncbi:MAG: restriction endonuclease subunit S [Paludibacteraceae bacterium]|nr:restriction endonuclease subunit S [Paludibacteraceae bacterium]